MPFFQSKRICILTAAVAAILLAMIASADVPQTINYQGRLTDSSGSPLDTIVDMTFTLTSGMSLPWTETHSDVVVTDGLFTVLLGSITPFHASLFESTGLSLGIEVGDGPMSDPLIPLASVPYALNAEHSDTADYAHTSPGSSANGWVDDGAVVRLESAGDRVGIGTSTPGENLVVGGDLGSFPESNYIVSGNSNFEEYSGFKLGYNADNHATMNWYGDGDQLTFNTRSMGVNYNNNLVLRAGKVGIGVDYPNEPLVVGADLGYYSGNMLAIGNSNISSFAGLTMGQDSDNRGWMVYDNEDDYIYWGTKENGTFSPNAMYFKGGNLGIGVSAPAGKLHVVGSGDGSVQLPTDAISAAEILNEPGIGNHSRSSSVTLDNDQWWVICRRVCDFPSSGYAVAIASCDLELLDIRNAHVNIGIFDSLAVIDPRIYTRYITGLTEDPYKSIEPITIHEVFEVGPGPRTFLFRVYSMGEYVDRTNEASMTIMFFPTIYGTVTKSSGASADTIDFLDAVGQPRLYTDQAVPASATRQGLEERLRALEEEIAELKKER